MVRRVESRYTLLGIFVLNFIVAAFVFMQFDALATSIFVASIALALLNLTIVALVLNEARKF